MTELINHPASPAVEVRSVESRIIGSDANWVRVRWKILGAARLVVPPFGGKGRADELWKTTCFELFLQQPGSASYIEMNLSPSERWNAYDFTDRRTGMKERPMPHEPQCSMRLGSDMAIFDAAIPTSGLAPLPRHCGFTAVIEEEGGVKSYWALAHAGAAPDFHDPACFLEKLGAPSQP